MHGMLAQITCPRFRRTRGSNSLYSQKANGRYGVGGDSDEDEEDVEDDIDEPDLSEDEDMDDAEDPMYGEDALLDKALSWRGQMFQAQSRTQASSNLHSHAREPLCSCCYSSAIGRSHWLRTQDPNRHGSASQQSTHLNGSPALLFRSGLACLQC